MIGARNVVALSDHFKLWEFESPDTGQVMLDGRLFAILDGARDALGVPLVITSAYRTVTHNRAVGGKPRSLHLIGAAVDLVVAGDEDRGRVVRWLAADTRVVVLEEVDHVHVELRGVAVGTEVVSIDVCASCGAPLVARVLSGG